MMTILKQSGRTVLALMLIMPLTSLYSYYKKEGGGQVYYFTQKKTDLNTGLFSYPKDFLITKETAEKTRLYYKVEFNPLFLPKYEGLYVNNKLVSEYKYHYNNTQLTRRDYYDNLMLIEKLSYFYNKRGVLIKVERRDSENNPTGDWYSYNNGMLTELTRYRNKKKSFIKKFKNGGLVETREILTKEIHVTRYNHSGQVVSEQKIKKPGFGDVAVLYEYQPLLLADISEIKKFSVTRPDWRCEFKLSGSSKTHWMIKEGISSYMAENPKITLLLREIKNLHSMKVFKGKGLKLSSYSLDKAKLRIELVDKDGMLHKILVGDEVEGENAYYVTNQLWGDVIYQVSRKKLDDILYLNKYNYIK
ncbi:MAG: DUF4340 domain-containing protein, partial [Spirochaetota bacterium]|nr:DUF4340 domain-containing protein [Spirochaetota bacterium]